MDKILELCLRSIIRNINNDHITANIYKNQAMQLHKKIEFKNKCKYPVEITVPEDIKNKLYEMVS